MNEHGEYSLKLVKNILHVYPIGGFNGEAIIAFRKDIQKTAPINKDWVLIEHPKNLAALTPEAAKELSMHYSQLEKIGCKAIGIEVNKFWEKVVKVSIAESKVDLPIYFNEIPEEFESLVIKHLSNK